MDFYSFQYPPCPHPSEAHRPARYYFHNLDQDRTFKRNLYTFQKEGVPPVMHQYNQAATPMTMLKSSATALVMTPATEQRSEQRSGKALSGSVPMGVRGIEFLDRSKFMAV
ncbi:hypothetical protein BGZ99_001887 [Dissophora globulifera]|uniref:Uncharacterized protein n=1 Tax=Dissophora globulifera TaxID=979702 RepID=A0A9P6UXU8_9FUNG|nr:hypothetical protein BGZ99_001887 [Dissophora globulifera]